MRILLVEDDPMLTDGLREAFARLGIGMDHLGRAAPALATVGVTAFDLLLIDLGLPDMDGLELLRRLRAAGHKVPVLVLTARDALEDRVTGLNLGADDYLVKPFAMPELIARVQALIRRSQSAAQSVITLGDLAMDTEVHRVTLGGDELRLTKREWTILQYLLLAAPRVLSKQKLADSLSQWDKEITHNAVEIYVSRLRAKFRRSAIIIRTVHGIGYRLEEVPHEGLQ
ncbi:MAG: response regulator transcription factor [Burkholderiaceae bacterium]|jgi:DNA-binding response OmpR family regulator|nr:response regulator transcription factor [Burkholderiaceae bacterium]